MCPSMSRMSSSQGPSPLPPASRASFSCKVLRLLWRAKLGSAGDLIKDRKVPGEETPELQEEPLQTDATEKRLTCKEKEQKQPWGRTLRVRCCCVGAHGVLSSS